MEEDLETLLNVKKVLKNRFKMMNMVTIKWFLGINLIEKYKGA